MPIEAQPKAQRGAMMKKNRSGDNESHARYDLVDADSLLPSAFRYCIRSSTVV